MFTLFAFVLGFLIIFIAPLMGDFGDYNQHEQAVSQLDDRGFENIQLSISEGTFVASLDGQYVSGDVLEKSFTELVVVMHSE